MFSRCGARSCHTGIYGRNENKCGIGSWCTDQSVSSVALMLQRSLKPMALYESPFSSIRPVFVMQIGPWLCSGTNTNCSMLKALAFPGGYLGWTGAD